MTIKRKALTLVVVFVPKSKVAILQATTSGVAGVWQSMALVTPT